MIRPASALGLGCGCVRLAVAENDTITCECARLRYESALYIEAHLRNGPLQRITPTASAAACNVNHVPRTNGQDIGVAQVALARAPQELPATNCEFL